MHLVAVACSDPELEKVLREFRDAQRRFHLHPITAKPAKRLLEGLAAVDFAGALIFDEALQRSAFPHVERNSLDAQEAEAVDTITVTQSGLIGEYNQGRALSAALREEGWDGREARAVVMGATSLGRAVARDLSSTGVVQLTVLAENRPDAEAILGGLAASTITVARAAGDPLSRSYLEQADLLVRVDPELPVPAEVLGPHLTVVDLAPEPVSSLRRQALQVGSLTLNLRDVQAHHIASALRHILGGQVSPGPFLEVLHQL